MEKLHIDCEGGDYDIVISPGSWAEAAAVPGRKLLVCDSNVEKLFRERAEKLLAPVATFVFPAGEEHKTIDTVMALCRRAAQLKLDRKCVFVALGGGVTGDLVGFAAAIYLLGVRVIQLPTTLLATVDSSVGGKTAVDIPEGKNLVGAFHQPCGVFIDAEALATLPARELKNGLAEAVKTAVLGDAELFDLLEKRAGELFSKPFPTELYGEVIRRCCQVKAAIVAADAHEHGCRAFLNYGHTFGHALELLSGFGIAHGEGVSLGMVVAAKLAVRLGICSAETEARQLALLRALGEPTAIPKVPAEAWLDAMRGDKKARDGRIVFILPEKIGSVRSVGELTDAEVLAFLRELHP
ncbi:MAG: 3-dehydroquinate synthase [Lentisphaeria bacterium]|nr:3-dehydroquinate synthase [Lentisphaeria bacterium]